MTVDAPSTSALVPLVLRRRVAPGQRPDAGRWVERSRSWWGRLTARTTLSIGAAACLLAYLVTGHVALFVVAVTLVPCLVASVAVWGGAHAWDRAQHGAVRRVFVERAPGVVVRNDDRQRRLVTLGLAAVAYVLAPVVLAGIIRRDRKR